MLRHPVGTGAVLFAVLTVALGVVPRSVSTQALLPVPGGEALTVAPWSLADIRAWDASITRMRREGRLRPVREHEDTLMPRRRHERLAQYHDGLLVFGAEVTRQSENGVPISMFGTLYGDITVATTPRLSPDDARRLMAGRPGVESVLGNPELLILPLDTGGFFLAYHLVATYPDDILVSFVDASSGRVLLQFTDLQAQGATGLGRGVRADTKTISTEPSGGVYRTLDAVRSPSIHTYDLNGNAARIIDLLNGRATLGMADLAADADNDWTNPAAVDAHVYAGWTSDYYSSRFGRHPLGGSGLAIRSVVHPVSRDDFSVPYYQQHSRFFTGAFWSGSLRLMVFGVGLPPNVSLGGQSWDFLSGSLELVAHELTHAVMQWSSNLLYVGESGALNEAFSDMMGTGAEFFFASARGRSGNYAVGDDVVTPGGLRSMSNPAVFGHPDHYSRRQLAAPDGFGTHTNSAIPGHAYYLAIEGGTNRTSGRTVQGVGSANRDQIEKLVYRAFTSMLPVRASFQLARLATIQSARDLYGAGSPAERAMTEAWDAVGVRAQLPSGESQMPEPDSFDQREAVSSLADPPALTIPSVSGLQLTYLYSSQVPGARDTQAFLFGDGRIAIDGGPTSLYSHDGGRTWTSGPQAPATFSAKVGFDFGDGEIVSFGRTTTRAEGLYKLGQVRSFDNWQTTTPEIGWFDTPLAVAFASDNGQMKPNEGLLLHHGIVRLLDGDLLATMYGNYAGDTALIEGVPAAWNMRKFRTIVVRSSDRGRHWSHPVTVAYDEMRSHSTGAVVAAVAREGFDEADMTRAANGDIVVVMRTGGRTNVEPQPDPTPIYLSRSTDEGWTWSIPVAITDRGTNPNIITLHNGVMVLTYGGKAEWIAFSDDHGWTWKGTYQLSGQDSYTDVVPLGPDRFMVFYFPSNGPGGVRGAAFEVRNTAREVAGRR